MRLAVAGLSKRFGGLTALDEVSVDFAAGEVHALLGENGAGKSTLMNLLNGRYAPDRGRILLDGAAVQFRSPLAAYRAGIGMVHQHFTLIDGLTVAENLAVAFRRAGEWRFAPDAAARRAAEFAAQVGLELAPPSARVGDLPVGVRQRIEILKALAGAGRVLILDEPTAVLTPAESEQLFAILRRLRNEGRAVIFITHKLSETLALADRITILRRGRVVGRFRRGEVDAAELAHVMVGAAAADGAALPQPLESAAPLLALRGIELVRSRRTLLVDVELHAAAGEIVGVAGVDGNGQSELFEVLTGLTAPSAGEVRIGGVVAGGADPAAWQRHGVANIPPDRHRDGLVLAMSVVENSVLSRVLLDRLQRRGWLDRAAMRAHAEAIVRQFDVRLGSIDADAGSLSGGNQQRLLIGRALAQQPRVLVAVNPTRGLDLAASRVVGDALRRAAAAGCAIVLISTDLDEVLALSHRVQVLYRGRLSAALRPPFDLDRLGLWMAGAPA